MLREYKIFDIQNFFISLILRKLTIIKDDIQTTGNGWRKDDIGTFLILPQCFDAFIQDIQ